MSPDISSSNHWRCRPRAYFTAVCVPLFIALSACSSTPDRVFPVAHWDRGLTAATHGFAVPEGFFVLRRTASGSEMEIYSPTGKILARARAERPILQILRHDQTLYFTEEVAPASSVVRKWEYMENTAPTDVVSAPKNWADIRVTDAGTLFGFESFFLTRDRPPSAVRIHDLNASVIIFEDLLSFHYPLQTDIFLILSPIDRKIRHFRDGHAEVIGEIIRVDLPPLARDDGEYAAWFGPYTDRPALFLVDDEARVTTLVAPLLETPIAWAGDDLLVARQEPDTLRWSIYRHEVPSGAIKAVYRVPSHVTPTKIVSSRTGAIIGLPLENGSLLLRTETGFIEELEGVPLSAWRFSQDGRTLYLLQPESLQIFEI